MRSAGPTAGPMSGTEPEHGITPIPVLNLAADTCNENSLLYSKIS